MVVDKSPISIGGNVGGIGGSAPAAPNTSANRPENQSPGASAFEKVLGNKIGQPAVTPNAAEKKFEGLKFSQHALERMSSRGISFKPEELAKLSEAVEKAAKKGSKESLVLMGDNALIVSVKNKTVVTAMDREAMKENVFTNIDSTVIL